MSKHSFSTRRVKSSFAARNRKIEGVTKNEFEKQKSKRIQDEKFLAAALDFILCRITIFITGVRPPQELLNIGDGTKIYYANHASHGDFLLIFVSLPYRVRKRVRPVAAAEYWESGPVRRFLAKNVFNMVLISRRKDPLEALTQMNEALQTHSLIIFPEGTRKMDDDLALQPFKSGIFRLAQQCPDVPLVPVWIKKCAQRPT